MQKHVERERERERESVLDSGGCEVQKRDVEEELEMVVMGLSIEKHNTTYILHPYDPKKT